MEISWIQQFIKTVRASERKIGDGGEKRGRKLEFRCSVGVGTGWFGEGGRGEGTAGARLESWVSSAQAQVCVLVHSTDIWSADSNIIRR
ncbi:hypothetical protein AKJ16_DCAP17675 [Drosera capensis]